MTQIVGIYLYTFKKYRPHDPYRSDTHSPLRKLPKDIVLDNFCVWSRFSWYSTFHYTLIRIPSIQFVIILVSSLLMNFSFVFIFKMIYAYFWVCFGFVFAKINCTFMFAMAHAKHIFAVSVSCLWSCLSLFFTSQCLKDVLRVSYLNGNKFS